MDTPRARRILAAIIFVCLLFLPFGLLMLVLGSAVAWLRLSVPALYEMWWDEPYCRLYIAIIGLLLLFGIVTAVAITARTVARNVLKRFPTIEAPGTLELEGRPSTATLVAWFAYLWGGIAAAFVIVVVMSVGFWTLRHAAIWGAVWRELSSPPGRYRAVVGLVSIVWALAASLPITLGLWLWIATNWLHLSDDDIDTLSGGTIDSWHRGRSP